MKRPTSTRDTPRTELQSDLEDAVGLEHSEWWEKALSRSDRMHHMALQLRIMLGALAAAHRVGLN